MGRSGLIIAALCAVLAGCGGDDPPAPSGSPRAPVLRFLADLQAGRYAQACAALDPVDVRNTRLNVISSARPPQGLSRAELRRWVRQLDADTKRCPVTLRLLAEQLSGRLPAITAAARTAAVRRLGESEVRFLGPQDWAVEPRDGAWRIIGADALAVAQESTK